MASFETMLMVKWTMIDRYHKEDAYGNRLHPETFKENAAAYERYIEENYQATCKHTSGETCIVVSIGNSVYLTDREWLEVTYIRPSHGCTPHDFYSGFWLPAGITLRG